MKRFAAFLALASLLVLASVAGGTISQKGTVRVAVDGKLNPKRLPRTGVAPIAVTIGSVITTTDQSLVPPLERIRIELNRHGRLDNGGIPPCKYDRIQPGSSSHALSACRSSLVGRGSFSATITLAGEGTYPTKGEILVFHGIRAGKPVLYGHLYSSHPFAASFVIVFTIQRLKRGAYGIVLDAVLPKAMIAWGRLTGIQMTLNRRFHYKGHAHSFLSSGCPTPRGITQAVFPLARTSFAFAEGRKLTSTLTKTCASKG